jgi:hypothetical protein
MSTSDFNKYKSIYYRKYLLKLLNITVKLYNNINIYRYTDNVVMTYLTYLIDQLSSLRDTDALSYLDRFV